MVIAVRAHYNPLDKSVLIHTVLCSIVSNFLAFTALQYALLSLL